MSIAEGIVPSILHRKIGEARPMKKNRWIVAYFPADLEFFALKFYYEILLTMLNFNGAFEQVFLQPRKRLG